MTRGRILQTGFTTQQIGRDNRYKYDSTPRMYKAALEQYGYDVDLRKAEPDEDISGYDAVFVGVAPLNGLGSRYCYSGLNVIRQAQQQGKAVVLFPDDWQTHLVLSGARTMLREPKRMVKPTFNGENASGATARVDFDWAVENLDSLIETADWLVNTPWPVAVMPLYDGGDWARFYPRMPKFDRLVGVDPSPFGTLYDTVIPADEDRKRSWAFGVLSDQRKWLDKLQPGWEVAHHGGRASKSEVGGLKDSELVQEYANSWGVLSCPYWHNGGGWYRIRHNQAMNTGSLLYSEGELSFISDAFDFDIHDAEGWSNAQLRERANAQRDAWLARVPTKDEAAARLGDAFAEEIARVK
jgi:hypothetical protein